MRRFHYVMAVALLGATGSAALLAEDTIAHFSMVKAYEAEQLIQTFTNQLQGELKAALTQGGPAQAVSICRDQAPAITAELSQQGDWQIGRTSLKPRNVADNAPDLWERRVLQQFEDRARAGADPRDLTYAEVIDGADGRVYRFMKAIPTGSVCLACHGQEIGPEVTEALEASYPQDQARGYTVGDLRGAFTLEKPL